MLYQTHVRVHLNNIRDNILAIRRQVGDQRKILIAVKANAYGHGALSVARMAQAIGVNYLGVATVPEGIELRQAGIKLPILKFSPAFPEEMQAALENQITLTICDQANAQQLDTLCTQIGVKPAIHLKVDTGMGRIGVPPQDAAAFAKYLVENCPNLMLEGVYTHLPVSDLADPTYTNSQLLLFKEVAASIEAVLGHKIPLVHCANSGGILGHPDSWMDMVRPGIMIYGYYPDISTPRTIALKPGLSFYTRVSFIKYVSKGTSIGYGRTWIATEDTWIATIPVGYADGFNRRFSNMGRVLIGGHSYPIVGRVCMDQSMVNLGPRTNVKVGDQVTLMGNDGGEEISCDEWAEKLGTITYEITCQINARVPRIYNA